MAFIASCCHYNAAHHCRQRLCAASSVYAAITAPLPSECVRCHHSVHNCRMCVPLPSECVPLPSQRAPLPSECVPLPSQRAGPLQLGRQLVPQHGVRLRPVADPDAPHLRIEPRVEQHVCHAADEPVAPRGVEAAPTLAGLRSKRSKLSKRSNLSKWSKPRQCLPACVWWRRACSHESYAHGAGKAKCIMYYKILCNDIRLPRWQCRVRLYFIITRSGSMCALL